MVLPRIQYVTHPDDDFENLSWVHRLAENGINWIQLRIKEEDYYERNSSGHYRAYFIDKADQMKIICDALGVHLTINDFPEIAFLSGTKFVHVGQTDSSVEEVKEIIGDDAVVGLSANTFSEVNLSKIHQADYIGVGPLRTTSTKTDTKENLGFQGYIDFLSHMKENNIDKPIFAIGGLTLEDLPKLREIGVYGFAISGLIFHSNHNPEIIKSIVELSK